MYVKVVFGEVCHARSAFVVLVCICLSLGSLILALTNVSIFRHANLHQCKTASMTLECIIYLPAYLRAKHMHPLEKWKLERLEHTVVL
ncbi:hypothetical protein V8E55_011734 [Tylopilus felleus]